jgi:hypothetical protein
MAWGFDYQEPKQTQSLWSNDHSADIDVQDEQIPGSATPVSDLGLGIGIFVVLVAIGQAVATCGMGLPLAVLAIWWVHKKGL